MDSFDEYIKGKSDWPTEKIKLIEELTDEFGWSMVLEMLEGFEKEALLHSALEIGNPLPLSAILERPKPKVEYFHFYTSIHINSDIGHFDFSALRFIESAYLKIDEAPKTEYDFSGCYRLRCLTIDHSRKNKKATEKLLARLEDCSGLSLITIHSDCEVAFPGLGESCPNIVIGLNGNVVGSKIPATLYHLDLKDGYAANLSANAWNLEKLEIGDVVFNPDYQFVGSANYLDIRYYSTELDFDRHFDSSFEVLSTAYFTGCNFGLTRLPSVVRSAKTLSFWNCRFDGGFPDLSSTSVVEIKIIDCNSLKEIPENCLPSKLQNLERSTTTQPN